MNREFLKYSRPSIDFAIQENLVMPINQKNHYPLFLSHLDHQTRIYQQFMQDIYQEVNSLNKFNKNQQAFLNLQKNCLSIDNEPQALNLQQKIIKFHSLYPQKSMINQDQIVSLKKQVFNNLKNDNNELISLQLQDKNKQNSNNSLKYFEDEMRNKIIQKELFQKQLQLEKSLKKNHPIKIKNERDSFFDSFSLIKSIDLIQFNISKQLTQSKSAEKFLKLTNYQQYNPKFKSLSNKKEKKKSYFHQKKNKLRIRQNNLYKSSENTKLKNPQHKRLIIENFQGIKNINRSKIQSQQLSQQIFEPKQKKSFHLNHKIFIKCKLPQIKNQLKIQFRNQKSHSKRKCRQVNQFVDPIGKQQTVQKNQFGKVNFFKGEKKGQKLLLVDKINVKCSQFFNHLIQQENNFIQPKQKIFTENLVAFSKNKSAFRSNQNRFQTKAKSKERQSQQNYGGRARSQSIQLQTVTSLNCENVEFQNFY